MDYPLEEDVRRDLQPLWDMLPGVIDGAISHVLQQFEMEGAAAEGTDFDPWFFAHYVRYRMKLRLGELGYHAANLDMGTVDVPNTGVWLYCQGYCIKVMRPGRDSLVPPPRTQTQRAYHTQVQCVLGLDFGTPLDAGNLVVVWETYTNHTLRRITVACPDINSPRWTFELVFPVAAAPQEVRDADGEVLDIPMEPIEEEDTQKDISDDERRD